LKRKGSAVCVIDPAARTVRQVLQRDDLAQGALQWLGPPANALVTRQRVKVRGAVPMLFFWINTQDGTVKKVTVPSFPGYSYKIGRWCPSGQAIALTASERTTQRKGSQVLVLWKRGWEQPKLLHKGKYLTFVVWSPDGKQLAVGEDRVHVRFVRIPSGCQ
ncbi:MAG: hypothetical protein KKI08_23155, partial [Armatimonadetes bacterium]|nr:hypothetical protein [Armatimonadota bacterium]